jgi:hypothetical protein
MNLVGSAEQQVRSYLYDATVALTGSAQLVLGQSQARSCLILQNLGANSMAVEFGSARATATLTSGAVSSIAVTNAGFNFTKPPVVRFLGGGQPQTWTGVGQGGLNTSYLGLGQPNAPAPSDVAQAHAVLSGNSVSSIVVDHGGSGYVAAPYVFITNSDLDPYGCATPALTSAGIILASGTGPLAFNGTFCSTDAISVIGTSADVLLCKWAP